MGTMMPRQVTSEVVRHGRPSLVQGVVGSKDLVHLGPAGLLGSSHGPAVRGRDTEISVREVVGPAGGAGRIGNRRGQPFAPVPVQDLVQIGAVLVQADSPAVCVSGAREASEIVEDVGAV